VTFVFLRGQKFPRPPHYAFEGFKAGNRPGLRFDIPVHPEQEWRLKSRAAGPCEDLPEKSASLYRLVNPGASPCPAFHPGPDLVELARRSTDISGKMKWHQAWHSTFMLISQGQRITL
jgi:hypothetical protein